VLVDKLRWINHTTVDLAFKQFGKHKCPGPDGYRPIVLCNLPFKARELLIQILNATIQLKYTPKLWRSSDVIFLPKPGKEDYTECRAFRPISLMPFLFKTLDRLVKWHMEQHATTLHKDQHNFAKVIALKTPSHICRVFKNRLKYDLKSNQIICRKYDLKLQSYRHFPR
jgi:hypothetical protein